MPPFEAWPNGQQTKTFEKWGPAEKCGQGDSEQASIYGPDSQKTFQGSAQTELFSGV